MRAGSRCWCNFRLRRGFGSSSSSLKCTAPDLMGRGASTVEVWFERIARLGNARSCGQARHDRFLLFFLILAFLLFFFDCPTSLVLEAFGAPLSSFLRLLCPGRGATRADR